MATTTDDTADGADADDTSPALVHTAALGGTAPPVNAAAVVVDTDEVDAAVAATHGDTTVDFDELMVSNARNEVIRISAALSACDLNSPQRALLAAELAVANANLNVAENTRERNKHVYLSPDWCTLHKLVSDSQTRGDNLQARADKLAAEQLERGALTLNRSLPPLHKRDFILAQLTSANIAIKEHPGVWDERMKLADWALGETQEREQGITDAINYIHGRSSFEIGRPGIAATWAAPGTGKTHFLDALALHIASSGDMPDHIVLPVTFNGVASRGTGDLRHLLCNILYSYFVGR
jgi:hypothetical protein